MAQTGSKGSVAEAVKSWVTTGGIIVAAVWAAYTFIYKEIWVPGSAPINISLDLRLEEAGIAQVQDQQSLAAIRIEMLVKNPSSRRVYLLPNVWQLYAQKVQHVNADKAAFHKSVNSAIQTRGEYYAEKYSTYRIGEVIAAGQAFEDFALEPSEVIRRVIIIHFPRNAYDLLEIAVNIPSSAKPNKLDLSWQINPDSEALEPIFYRINGDGSRTKIDWDAHDSYCNEQSLECQSSETHVQLSLWH